MRALAIVALCAACAGPPPLRKDLSALAWMVGDWSCDLTSLDSGAVEPARLRVHSELGGAWIRAELQVPGRGKEPLFEQVSHFGFDGRWTRVDVDASGRFKLLHAESAGDSTLWTPAETPVGTFRERISRDGAARWESIIDVREAAGWTKAITWACTRR